MYFILQKFTLISLQDMQIKIEVQRHLKTISSTGICWLDSVSDHFWLIYRFSNRFPLPISCVMKMRNHWQTYLNLFVGNILSMLRDCKMIVFIKNYMHNIYLNLNIFFFLVETKNKHEFKS